MGIGLTAVHSVLLPRWIKVRCRFAFLPTRTQDTRRIVWLRDVWEIEDAAWEEFLGLLPLYEHYEHERNAWAALAPTPDYHHA